jgi:hypothetical protein
LLSTAGKRDSFSISALGSPDTANVVLSQDLKRRWVDSLLVDDDKVLVVAFAELVLELDDLHDLVICELTLRLDEFLSLISIRPEESGVHLSLFILKRNV